MTTQPLTGQSIGDLPEMVTSWGIELHAANLSPATIRSYMEAARRLEGFLRERGMPTDVSAIHREHVEAFVVDQLERHKPTTAAVRFASLKVFFKWLAAEGEIRDSPMARMRKPKLPEHRAYIPTIEDLKRLLAVCAGSSFDDLRDTAIIRTFISTGARLSEVGNMTSEDVDLVGATMTVLGKGRRERVSFLDAKAVKAIDRYRRRARKVHRHAELHWLWLGKRGQFGPSGISQMVRERGDHLGLPQLTPHSFRHFYADRQLGRGMQESDLMALAGWRSPEMLRRYASARRTDRALAAARRMSPGDDL
ncbi:site-specific tyrosine recombinase XerD [soil metagenome]